LLNHILCFQITNKKEIFRQQIKEFLDKEKEFKETKKREEEIENKLTEIYRRSKQKIEKMQKEKVQEVSNY
jgi:predicted transcriptional regulator